MSSAEIADNKWELEASKPPVSTAAGILQVLLLVAFAGVFIWILIFTFRGIFGEKKESLADQYGKMTVEGGPVPAGEAAPKAE